MVRLLQWSRLSNLTPQFGGRALAIEARRESIMKWRARAVAATMCYGPLQLLVIRFGVRHRDWKLVFYAHVAEMYGGWLGLLGR